MVEYDWRRVAGRLFLTLLFGFFLILVAHDTLPSYHPPLSCTGGSKEALEFFIELFIAAMIIEASRWMLWQSVRKIQGGQVSKTSPKNITKFVFGVAILVATAVLHLLPNPCDGATFGWRGAFDYFLLAYAFLTIARIVPGIPT
jgi:hypothetical protein